MSATGSGIFDWDLLDDAPTVTSFTLDPTEVEEWEKEIHRVEETILEGAGRAADALAGSSADPATQGTRRRRTTSSANSLPRKLQSPGVWPT